MQIYILRFIDVMIITNLSISKRCNVIRKKALWMKKQLYLEKRIKHEMIQEKRLKTKMHCKIEDKNLKMIENASSKYKYSRRQIIITTDILPYTNWSSRLTFKLHGDKLYILR